MTRPLIPQCRWCRKVRIGAEWVRDDTVAADVVGQCRDCMNRQIRQAEIRRQIDSMRVIKKYRRPHKVGEPDWDAIQRGE